MSLDLLSITLSLSIIAIVVFTLLLLWLKRTRNTSSSSVIVSSQVPASLDMPEDVSKQSENGNTGNTQPIIDPQQSAGVDRALSVVQGLERSRNDELNTYRMLIIATRHTIHDGKNLMINIKLAVEEMREKILTLDQGEIQEETGLQLDSIVQSTNYLTRMLEGLLYNFERTGSAALERETVNIRELWNEVKQSLLAEAKRYNVRLITLEDALKKLAPADLEIDIDQELIKQALRELVHNGIKYGRLSMDNRLESEAKVAVGFTADDRYLNIHILDTGCGISNDEKAKIFEPGFRGQNAHPIEGAGIGLYSVQTTVDAHGGVLELDNHPTKIPWSTKIRTKWSTMFIVKLPRQRE